MRSNEAIRTSWLGEKGTFDPNIIIYKLTFWEEQEQLSEQEAALWNIWISVH